VASQDLPKLRSTMASPSTNLDEYQRRVHSATVWCAAERDDSHTLRRILDIHPNVVHALDEPRGGHPALYVAANDSVNALKLLRQHGADLEMYGPRNLTAVYAAAASGSLRTLRYLIEAKVDLDVECDDGFGSALEYLGAPCEIDGVYDSRLYGTPLEAAKMVG